MAQRVCAISQLHLTHNINVQFTYAGVLYADCTEGRGGGGSPQPHAFLNWEKAGDWSSFMLWPKDS